MRICCALWPSRPTPSASLKGAPARSTSPSRPSPAATVSGARGSYFFTNEQFWARPFFRTTDFDPFYQHDLSATFGGPIVKSRTFFFASIQPLRSRLTNADQVQTYESPEFVAWARQNFPNSLGTRVLSEYPHGKRGDDRRPAHRPRHFRRRLRHGSHPQHSVRPADGGRGPLQAEPVPQRPPVEHPGRPQFATTGATASTATSSGRRSTRRRRRFASAMAPRTRT